MFSETMSSVSDLRQTNACIHFISFLKCQFLIKVTQEVEQN